MENQKTPPPSPSMTKVTSSKSISSARATPMGSRPSQNPNSPVASANKAANEIVRNYGNADATEDDHQMSTSETNSPNHIPSGDTETTPTRARTNTGPVEIEVDTPDADDLFSNPAGVHDSMHAPQRQVASSSSSANIPLHKRPTMTISLRNPPPPPPVTPTSAPSTSRSAADIIRAQLATANTNRALTHPSASNPQASSAFATPVPEGGFPHTHLSSPAQLLHFLSPQFVLHWTEIVDGPKCLLRIFDYDGKDASARVSKLAELLRTTIISIAPFTLRHKLNPNVAPPAAELGRENDGSPEGFLLHEVPEEYIDLLLRQRIWSTPAITFEARPFLTNIMPTYLFTLKGLSARPSINVTEIVRNIWQDAVSLHDIESILVFADDLRPEEIHEATMQFFRSIEIERLNFKEKGSIQAPRYNVLATSPTSDAEVWTRLRLYLRGLPYPSPVDGIGFCSEEDSFFPCSLCHSVAHPRGLCPFPSIPNWYGGGYTKENEKSKDNHGQQATKNKGKGRRMY
ncbi:hypothetical protein BJ138DRAFT_1231400 [Hygrophoropsis aurantiaca]|uniref:Uncharacterized protein n=1 Tax=Hygrophoropsis aurantiaca TaxID=72124 RepID=A0ACB7ZVM8_9AGAM|nr:hypothetical protein BJ138DRAFT_1231400 [Hygrophoropsis aurantiaca]